MASKKDQTTKRMHEIQGFTAISNRHAAYERELEALAMDVENYLEVLVDKPTSEAVSFVVARLKERLEKVYKASKV